MNKQVLDRAAIFLWEQARLLDRRLFQRNFHDGGAEDVLHALRAYRNDDGGFGHALEPDLRTPNSQPIFVEIALNALHEARIRETEWGESACGFLESVSSPDGAVSPALPGASEFPCANHFELEWAVTPGLNPTAGLAGRLHELGVKHPWLDRATDWSLEQVESQTIVSAHAIRSVTTLLEHLPDRTRAEGLVRRVMEQLLAAEWFTLDVPVTEYTQTPLNFATAPDSMLRPCFEDGVIEAHLDDLIARQQPDGGWPVLWEAPGPASVCEWRGRWTLDALLVLRAYGRL